MKNDTPLTVSIPNASGSWGLVMQSGVEYPCTVGISVSRLLSEELGLSREQIGLAEAILLDGMPVDDAETALVPQGCRLALAAGLPGIAGLAMKKDSGVKVLRATITHFESGEENPRPGGIVLLLYSLVLPALAGHFLSRGVLITFEQFKRYAQYAFEDMCHYNDQELSVENFIAAFQELPDSSVINLIANMSNNI